MSDEKVMPKREATGWEKLTGQAKPTREATGWEKLTDQATPAREATGWEKLTGQATPTREATTWEKVTNQATPTREATWFEKLTQGGNGSFGTGYSLGEKLGKLAIIVLTIVFCVPGLILDKLFPARSGTSRLWLYSIVFWSFVGATILFGASPGSITLGLRNTFGANITPEHRVRIGNVRGVHEAETASHSTL